MSQTENAPEPVMRWTAKRKASAVLEMLRGETTAVETARKHGLTLSEVEGWKDTFLSLGTEGLRSNPRDAEARFEAEKKDLLSQSWRTYPRRRCAKKNASYLGRDLVSAIKTDMLAGGTDVSLAALCRILGVARSTTYYRPVENDAPPRIDEVLAARIRTTIDEFPTAGIRGVWSRLRFRQGIRVTLKKVARIMRLKGWTVTARNKGSRPRVKGKRSRTFTPDIRWATDFGRVQCGKDGWCAFAPVIDCCTRQILGWALAHTQKTKTAEMALEEALFARFGHLKAPAPLALRSDNGLVFASRSYQALARSYGLTQEFIAPYTPEQNGLCERFIKTFKEECAWLNNFKSIGEAREAIASFITYYNSERPHQALNYETPNQHHKKHLNQCKLTA